MDKYITYCMPTDKAHELCKECLRRRNHPKVNEFLKDTIVSLTVLRPNRLTCDGYIKEK